MKRTKNYFLFDGCDSVSFEACNSALILIYFWLRERKRSMIAWKSSMSFEAMFRWLLAGVFVVLIGCSGAKPVSSPSSPEVSQTAPVEKTKDSNHDRALDHFIQGSVYDMKGEYAKAILEYQDALRYHEDPAIYHALSKDYLLLEKYALAAKMGEKSVNAAPGNIAYRKTLADVYIAAFETDKAVTQYETIVQLDSNSADSWYNLARLYEAKKPLRALEVYQSIIERFGASWEVYRQVAEIYSNLGKYDQSAEAIKEMLSIDPSNRRLKITLADAYDMAGNYDEALRLYDELLELNPEDIDLQSAVAGIHIKKKDYREAANHYSFILDQDSVPVESKLRIGEMYFRELQSDSTLIDAASEVMQIAIPIFRRIALSYPSDWRAYWFLGAMGALIEDDSLAVRNLRKVTELASWNRDAWLSLSQVYFRNTRFGPMAKVLERAIKELPEEFQINLFLGVAYSRLGRNEDAVRVLETAVELNPQSIPALSTLALSYDNLRRYADSDRIYEQALKIEPNNHLILNNYGYSLSDRGIQLERALRMAKEAVQQQPENSSYLDTLGWAYFRLGEYEDAQRYVMEAIDAGDTSAVIHEHLGDIYAKLNELDKALEFWQKAYEIDSSNETLREKIERGRL